MMAVMFITGMVIGGMMGLLVSALCTISAIEDLEAEIRRERLWRR